MKKINLIICTCCLLALGGCGPKKTTTVKKVKKEKVEILDYQEMDGYANPKMTKEFA